MVTSLRAFLRALFSLAFPGDTPGIGLAVPRKSRPFLALLACCRSLSSRSSMSESARASPAHQETLDLLRGSSAQEEAVGCLLPPRAETTSLHSDGPAARCVQARARRWLVAFGFVSKGLPMLASTAGLDPEASPIIHSLPQGCPRPFVPWVEAPGMH